MIYYIYINNYKEAKEAIKKFEALEDKKQELSQATRSYIKLKLEEQAIIVCCNDGTYKPVLCYYSVNKEQGVRRILENDKAIRLYINNKIKY